MNDIPLAVLFSLLGILLLLSGFFSGSETALMTINRYRLAHRARNGERAAKLTQKLLERPDRLIGLILLGNNLVNILAASIATVIGIRLFGQYGIGVASAALTVVVLLFGEVTPKTLAALHPERVALPASYVYWVLKWPLFPIVWVINLIGNAIRYTDTGSVTVRAVASQPDGIEGATVELRIEVIDSGVGIPPERIDSVFDPFTQLDSARASGTGLGLSIVRHLVTLMGGCIEVDSTPGIGSRFVVVLPELPVVESATADGVDVLPADERVLDNLPPMSVLAVDDVALNRSLIEAWLAETHHQVRTAGSGPEGIERALSERPDVILMDIRMPGMDGVEALRQIRRLPELDATKVIALTASSLLGEEGRLRELFDGYLRKPVSRNSLGQELARLLDGAIDAGSRSGDAAEAAAEIDDDDARAWSEHAAAIHAALAGARGTMSTDEVRQVLKSIAALPPTPAFRELSLLADEIRRAVDIFDIVTLESALSRCADMVQRLDQAARLIEA